MDLYPAQGRDRAGKTKMPAGKGFKVLEHTADEYILAYGCSLGEAFESAAFAMSEVMTDTTTVEPRDREIIEAEAEDEKALLYLWLEKILIKFDAEGKLYSKFNVNKIERRGRVFRLEATIWGEPYDPNKHPSRTGVKAVTYHMMKVLKKKDGAAVKFLLDV
ncbi:MAG: archease [Candidatus Bathyarchaeota archaeon]